MLGVLCAIAAAASFGFNNASARRGVLTGTALQGLAISMPLGVLLFRMIFAYFINRQHEEFDRWVVAGILLSFVGALALSVSDAALLAHLPLPAWIAELASWRWP